MAAIPRTSLIRKSLLALPFTEPLLNALRNTLIATLKLGPIPRHVAFVMDGNRRFAREHRLETVEGHHLGFEALARVLEVCYKTGVQVVTIYAFSIENFKRPAAEVAALMDMARTKLVQLAEHGELLDRYGASIRVLGQRGLMDAEVLAAIDRAVDLTKHNTRAVLNVCFPYTSRDEITTAVRGAVESYATPIERRARAPRPFSERSIARNLLAHDLEPAARPPPSSMPRETLPTPPRSQQPSPESSPSHSPAKPVAAAATALLPDPESITADTITAHLFTADNPPLDMLVRTSGVQRLSDFMLWQCHDKTSIAFLECLWPEFDLWHFLPVLVEWQWWRMRG